MTSSSNSSSRVLRLRLRNGAFERAPYEVLPVHPGSGFVVLVLCEFPVRPDHGLAIDPTNPGRVIEVSGAEAQVFATAGEAWAALEQWERQMRGEG